MPSTRPTRPRRTYTIRKIYVVICSQCGENICERADEPTTRAEAEAYKASHEETHRRDDQIPASVWAEDL